MLEKLIRERFRVSPKETVYFSKSGQSSSKPTQKNFLKTWFDNEFKLIRFEFEQKIDWEQIEEFYTEKNITCRAEFFCDDERFYDLSTEYNTLSPPFDPNIEDYELIMNNEHELLDILSDGVYSLRFELYHENFKEKKHYTRPITIRLNKEELKIQDEEATEMLLDSLYNTHEFLSGDVIKFLVKLPDNEYKKLHQIKLEENILMSYDELEERVKKQRDIMLKIPDAIRRGKLNTSFKYTDDCEIDYYLTKIYNSLVDLYRDANFDWSSDSLQAVKTTGIASEELGYDIVYSMGKCYVHGKINPSILGRGKLEQFLRNFN
ncbi:hypothetical protein COV11_00715 [Candidatus Woesearchaeota archaeon CG10_big_fil_rev_8_21_14_0_10_30_7]|nr:MAG: hypothetical protein COV11_00715 [Candidatus Woesearchaeota archaeon CG10_big_fil_rev_8_21_14_0_10_30_7]